MCCAQTREKCKAFLKTQGDNVVTEIRDEHNHSELNEDALNRQMLSNSLKRKAVEDVGERPIKILQKELRNGDISTLTTKDVALVRKNMYNARRSLLPKLSKSMEETHDILKTFPVKTNKNEDFLMVNDIENQIIMFSCSSNLEFLADLDTIYIDGTFEYCPKFFKQMFSIHGLKEDHYIPLVFFSLPSKQKHTYTLALKYLTEQVEKCNKKLALRTVFADFEEAIQQSVTEVWTHVSLKGC
ncbi:uncharacterized protein LOC126882824 [Diabrotica virgifera virgifera]|uniref:MULE transposase domain-containing protein n=1 Tax=Diabrotica virgifera virgifera TaxID=50390 RepID=A0ABM5K113_DIAVI|nr:uncharacterized protein LOC126882824 [Diabrotica virgifera virgifera]